MAIKSNKGISTLKRKYTKCPRCGDPVSEIGKYKPFCDPVCRDIYSRPPKKCPECQKEFPNDDRNKVYCSKICWKIAFDKRGTPSAILIRETNVFKLFKRDNFKCVYCGISAHDGAILTLDHVFPMGENGGNDIFNLVTSCRTCNTSKGNSMLLSEKILELWERNKRLDESSGLYESYEELKCFFDKIYKSRKAS